MAPHVLYLYATCRYDVNVDTGEKWLVRDAHPLAANATVTAMSHQALKYLVHGCAMWGASKQELFDAAGTHVMNIDADACLFVQRSYLPRGGVGVMGNNTHNALVVFEFEHKNRSTPSALAHGAAIMRAPRVRVLIYG